MQKTDFLQYLADRIENLERQNRLLKRVGLALLVFPVIIAVMGQARPSRSEVFNRLAITDADGRERVTIQIGVSGPELQFRDANGSPIATLAEVSDGVRMLMRNPKAGALADFSTRGNSSDLILLGGDKGAGVSLTGSKARSEMLLTDASEQNRVDLIETETGGASVMVSDQAGFSAAIGQTKLVTEKTGETHKSSAASLILFGKDKKTLWSAP